ncbi:hypothetical protein Tco_1123010 [Tanacetum coccineum]|uniref:Uncharacterized protein n=1 Tax=Tanacetum coccineum TaxID=301880 RepID=A0ABQ5J3J5_9ASTR
MSTSNTHQQSLTDVGFETRPPMLERCSYIPWASCFRRYLNRKRENRKRLNKAIDEGDELKQYEAEIEAMNLILISIPNDIYNFVDACTTAKAMWQRVERLMRGEALVAKKLKKSHDPLALVAYTGCSSRTTSPYYVKHPSSVVDYDEDYQGDAIQKTYEDPLTSAMILLARAITQCFSNQTNNHLRTSSNTRNQAIVQADKVHIQSRNSGNDGRNTKRSYVQEEVIEGTNVQNDAGNIQRNLRTTSSGTAANDEAGVILTDEKNDFLFADASRMEELEELSANICLIARIQSANFNSATWPSYDSAFFSEVQTPSTSYENPLFAKDVNSGSVEYDNNVQESYKLEQLARNAYKEAEKQQIIAKKVQQQNIVLTKQLESYKEKNPKLYDASCLDDSKIQMNVRDIKDILDDATKSQIKMKKKSQDPIAIEKKQNVWTIDYKKLYTLYEDFVPQKEFSTEQKYFSSSFISFKNSSNASSLSSSFETKPTVAPMPSANHLKLDLNKMENEFQKFFALLKQILNVKSFSILLQKKYG